jgi:hypothetical protein
MSFDYRSRCDVDVAHSPRSQTAHVRDVEPLVSEETRAENAVSALERGVKELVKRTNDVEAAVSQNHPEGYAIAREAFERAKQEVAREQTAAQKLREHTAGDVRTRLDNAVQLADETAGKELPAAPTGIVRLSVEDRLLEILPSRPVTADLRETFDRVDAQLRVVIANMSTADTVALQNRLQRNAPSDELVKRLKQRLLPNRLAEIVEHLKDPKRRARVRHEEARAKTREVPHAETEPTEPAHGVDAKEVAHEHAPMAEPRDAKLMPMASGEASNAELAAAIAMLDRTERRALARRLENYRPGCGDELSARFAKLDSARRKHILTSCVPHPSTIRLSPIRSRSFSSRPSSSRPPRTRRCSS